MGLSRAHHQLTYRSRPTPEPEATPVPPPTVLTPQTLTCQPPRQQSHPVLPLTHGTWTIPPTTTPAWMDSTRDRGLVLMGMKLDREGLRIISTHQHNLLTQKLFKLLTVHRFYNIQPHILLQMDKYHPLDLATVPGIMFSSQYFFNTILQPRNDHWNLGVASRTTRTCF